MNTEQHLGGHESAQGTRDRTLRTGQEGERETMKSERPVRVTPCHAEKARWKATGSIA